MLSGTFFSTLMVNVWACIDTYSVVDIFWAQLVKTNDVFNERIVKFLIIKYGLYVNIFADKIFQQNTCELDMVLTSTVDILTTNELVKLTML